MDTSRPDVAPITGGVATSSFPDDSISTSQISAMVAAAQSAQPLSAAYAGRSPAESHGSYFMGRNMLVHVMMDQQHRFQGRQSQDVRSAPPTTVAGIPEESRKRKASPGPTKSDKKVKLKDPPAGLKSDAEVEGPKPTKETEDARDKSCCICMCDPDPMDSSSIDGCDHTFCFECIEQWGERENTCPLCKERFFKIERIHKRARGRRGGAKGKNSVKVTTRNQRADLNQGGNPFESLLANISVGGLPGTGNSPHSIARLIFSTIGPTGLRVGVGIAARQQQQLRQQQSQQAIAVPTWQTAARTGTRFEDNLLLSDDEGSEEDGFHSFVHHIGASQFPGSIGTPQFQGAIYGSFGPSEEIFQRTDPAGDPRAALQQQFHATLAAQRSRAADRFPPRNFASNYLQAGAGNTANAALEICGSDSDDDEIEVVQVTQGRDV